MCQYAKVQMYRYLIVQIVFVSKLKKIKTAFLRH